MDPCGSSLPVRRTSNSIPTSFLKCGGILINNKLNFRYNPLILTSFEFPFLTIQRDRIRSDLSQFLRSYYSPFFFTIQHHHYPTHTECMIDFLHHLSSSGTTGGSGQTEVLDPCWRVLFILWTWLQPIIFKYSTSWCHHFDRYYCNIMNF